MTNLQATGANAAQIEFWNGQAAAGWVEHQQHMDALLEPLSVAALQRAAIHDAFGLSEKKDARE